jgi:hypothetical protein
MLRTLLAAAAAVAFFAASPALACPDCKDCPMHKVAATEKTEKKDAAPKEASCGCAKDGSDCKCGAKCTCANCAAHKKAEEKKS